jgi:hypothetical protein
MPSPGLRAMATTQGAVIALQYAMTPVAGSVLDACHERKTSLGNRDHFGFVAHSPGS